jgi:Phage integrase family
LLVRARPAAQAAAERCWPGCATGCRRNLSTEEDRAFWARAAIEVLRATGVRIEELTELSHHSLVQYRLPGTGELVPLLQIAPSKTDTERLLVISPELADVLATVISRLRGPDGTVPLVAVYDDHERLWLPPAPARFQRRVGSENRPIPAHTIRKLLAATLARTGLTGPGGQPLHYTPHDFRRMFLTDAILSGLPPHIAQVIAGHRDINVTLGYKAVYPDEAIQAHLAFLARRRALRPTEEYRSPTDTEWQEFLGHFERRKVATGICGRAFGTPCIHEHSCLRCALHWPDPAQRPRIAEIRDNLIAPHSQSRTRRLARRNRRPENQPRRRRGQAHPDRPPRTPHHRPRHARPPILNSDTPVSTSYAYLSKFRECRRADVLIPAASPRRSQYRECAQ